MLHVKQVQIPIGIHARIYTSLEGFRMYLSIKHVIHSLYLIYTCVSIYITSHPSSTNAKFWERIKSV